MIIDPVDVLEDLARSTWARITDGHRMRIRQGEVAITDYVLLELARLRMPSIHIFKTPPSLERLKGTDWEWWIGSARVGWLRYAMQAKRISYPDDYYHSLGHRVNGQRQVDLLANYARANRAIGLYCFYNATDEPRPQQYWHCNLNFELEQLGCTVVPVSVIRKAVSTRGGRSFQSIHSHRSARPWRCLVACPRIQSLYTSGPLGPFPMPWPLSPMDEVTLHRSLPAELGSALETGEIETLSPQFFNSAVAYYPHRIAIIDTTEVTPTRPDQARERVV